MGLLGIKPADDYTEFIVHISCLDLTGFENLLGLSQVAIGPFSGLSP